MPAYPRRNSRISRIPILGALCLAFAMFLAACSGNSSDSPNIDGTSDKPASVEIPDTPAGKTTQMLVDALNSDDDAVTGGWEGKFHDSFTAAVSLEDFVELLNVQFRPAQPFTATEYSGTEREAVTRLENPTTDPIVMSIVIDEAGLITGLRFTPAEPDTWVAPNSLSELEDRLQEFPATIRALILTADTAALAASATDAARATTTTPKTTATASGSADIAGPGGEVLLDFDSETSAPLGSMFKLYVLLAVADAIDEGVLQWDEELEVNDTVRSLPSGELQNASNGTKVTVREAASKMISISDNTATDMLMQRLGRERIEAAVVAAGHHKPSEMVPFQTTRELFQIGWSDPELLSTWRDSDAAQRRSLLDRIATQYLDPQSIALSGAPVWPDGVEWFASPQDIARVHLALNQQEDPEIRAILSENPGVAAPDWDYVAFKGGSSPGVLTGSWLVTDTDGTTAVLVWQASTTELAGLGLAQQSEFFRLAQSALALAHG